MRRYKLPAVLGGGEIEATETWGGCAGGRPEYQIGAGDNGFTLLAPRGTPLDAVPPPAPAEPEPGAYLVGGVICVHLPAGPIGCTWFIAENDGRPYRWADWAETWDRLGAPIVPLVPRGELS